MENESISVNKFFQGRSILITGVTGHLGTVVLEKLLRSCDSLEKVYVLIRPFKGQRPEERLEKLLQSSIFNDLHEKSENIFKKVVLIPGDVTHENLGISTKQNEILVNNISVIFHVAATVKFQEPLIKVMKINFVGTLRVLELSRTMKKLVSLVHVSTAFTNVDRNPEIIEETIYPVAVDPNYVMEVFQWLHDLEILDGITPKILGKKPNTYIFSKQLTESLLERKAKEWNLPISIVRPSIVASVHKDPISSEGWVGNLSAINWIVYCFGHGLQDSIFAYPHTSLDVIPVDYVSKIMILAAWDMGIGQSGPSPIVYNACIQGFNHVKNKRVVAAINYGLERTPYSRLLRPTRGLQMVPSPRVALLRNRIYCGLIFILLDLKAMICFQRPKMLKTYWRIEDSFVALSFFCSTDFLFNCSNVKRLRSKILPEDALTFDLRMEDVNWEDYIPKLVHGIRLHYDKDPDSTIPSAGKHFLRLKFIFSAIEKLFILSVLFVLFRIFRYALFDSSTLH